MPNWWIALTALLSGVLIGYFFRQRNDDEVLIEAEGRDEHSASELAVHSWFQTLLGALTTGVLCIDARDSVIATNVAASRLFGGSVERMLGRATIEATGSMEIDRRVTEARAGTASRGEVEVTTSWQRLILDVAVEPLAAGGALLLAFDVTALRESERIRHEFLGNISHELRTPLAGIKLMFETLEAVDDPETRAYFYPLIGTEIDRLIELVEHLLDVARAEGGRIQLKREAIELHELLAGALIPIEQRLSERNIRLKEELEPVFLRGDAARLTQVLINLVENALRHTPPGGEITVRTRTQDHTAILEVADTGCGIPYKDLPHIFERFYVVDRSRAKATGGLGLGLALVKGSVEAHGGTITVISEFGVGSCFTARFPLDES